MMTKDELIKVVEGILWKHEGHLSNGYVNYNGLSPKATIERVQEIAEEIVTNIQNG